MVNKTIKIALDGPSGSGKSTLAKHLAKHYGFVYIDTGALYRTIGLFVSEKGIASEDAEKIIAVLPEIHIEMRLEQGERIVEVLKQDRNAPVTVEHQIMIIYAVINNFLQKIPANRISEFEAELYEFINDAYPEITDSIKQSGDLTKENTERLNEILKTFVDKFLNRQ